jgi:hypothetical protein
MPEHQDPEAYRLQARLWQRKAGNLSNGEERDVYLVIADGYARLAQLLEQKASAETRTAFNPASDHGQQSKVG